MDIITAVWAEKAWMSRNSKVVEFSGKREGETLDHDEPELVVRRTVPEVPETQTILSVTGARPRYCRVVFVGVKFQERGAGLGWALVNGRRVKMREDLGSIMVGSDGDEGRGTLNGISSYLYPNLNTFLSHSKIIPARSVPSYPV
jgi:hypothetical protein